MTAPVPKIMGIPFVALPRAEQKISLSTVGEREREQKVGGVVVVRDSTVLEGGNRNRIWQFEGSQAVPASPSGRGEACIRFVQFRFFFNSSYIAG
jgi:hypothetical protein